MHNIAQFLDAFKNIGAKGLGVRKTALEVIQKRFSIELSMKDITFKEGILTVVGNPSLKNALYIKKGFLIQEISQLSGTPIKDIR